MITFYLTVEAIKRIEPEKYEVRAFADCDRAKNGEASLFFIVNDPDRVPQVGRAMEVTVRTMQIEDVDSDFISGDDMRSALGVQRPTTSTNAPVDIEYTNPDSN